MHWLEEDFSTTWGILERDMMMLSQTLQYLLYLEFDHILGEQTWALCISLYNR